MNKRRNHYYATAETQFDTDLFGVIHVFEDVNGVTKEVLLERKFTTLQEAELFASELNDQNQIPETSES